MKALEGALGGGHALRPVTVPVLQRRIWTDVEFESL